MASLQGAILGSGKVQIHRTGWRSEKAEIIAFLRPGKEPFSKRIQESSPSLALDQLMLTLSLQYGVPIFNTDKELLEYAGALGVSISEEDRP